MDSCGNAVRVVYFDLSKVFSRDYHDMSINEMVNCELGLVGSKLTE